MSRRTVPVVFLLPLLALALLVSSSACGTVGSMIRSRPDRDGRPAPPPPPYSGVVEDVSAVWESKASDNVALVLFDLPLSATADTALLPVTLFLNIRALILGELLTRPAKRP